MNLCRGFSELGLVIKECEVHVMILGLPTNSKTPSFQAGEKNAHQLAEACRI
jgi:hypothetical protein